MSDCLKNFKLKRQTVCLPILLVILVALQGCGKDETAATREVIRPVRAVKVGDATQLTQRSFPGRAKATQELELSFRVSGPLITRPVNVGDEVKQGDVVARIDPRDYEVKVANVEGQLEEAQAASRRAESEYERELRILQRDPGATSETAVERKREERDRSKANVKSLEASLDAAKDQLDYTYLKAPFNGTVVATYVENFEDVRPKQPVLRLVDTSRIEMIVNIPENLISLSPYVKEVDVSFDAFPGREIRATIKEIGTEASQTTRTYPVTLIMDQPEDIKILPGMAGKTLRAEIDTPEGILQTGLKIPITATFSQGEIDKTYVWVIDEQAKTVSRREIKTAELTDQGIKVVEGLKSGEWIATAGVNYLREGQQVMIAGEPGG